MSKTVSGILKWSCLAISFISLLIAGGLMWVDQETNVNLPQAVHKKNTGGEAGTQVESPWMVERKGKRVLWRLKARHAEQGLTQMDFTHPYLELFNEKNEKITVQAQQASLNTLNRDVHFQGKVVVHFQTWTLTSNTLDVEHSSGDILVPEHFIAHNPTTILKGRGLRVQHEKQAMWIQHDVWMQQDGKE
ncbi:MAG: LPS export ABC transporter periplasmic protein LptC [Mariprofundaceae bacterium]|nr:LPS export ABC transporter periplasmic protein LptC [Mariprofundaceae bacterium]